MVIPQPGNAGTVLTSNGSTSVPGWSAPGVTLAGDVTGPSGATVDVRINGSTVPAGPLTTGNVLQASGVSALSYGPVNLGGGSGYVSGVLPAGNQAAQTLSGAVTGPTTATVIAPGVAGQVLMNNGTPAVVSQTVTGDTTISSSGVTTTGAVHGATVPAAGGALTVGNSLGVTGASSLGYGPLNLAGGASYVTGALPAGNQVAQTLTGDVTGTTAADVVTGLSYASTIPVTGPGFTFAAAQAAPTITQAGTGPNLGTAHSLTLTPQAPDVTSGTPGSVVVNLVAPTGAGNEAGLVAEQGGTTFFQTNAAGATSGNAGIWLGAPAPTSSNAIIYGGPSGLYLDSVSVTFQISGGNTFAVQSGPYAMYSPNDLLTQIGTAGGRFNNAYIQRGVNGGTHSTSGNGVNMAITAEGGNTTGNGGDLQLAGGGAAGGGVHPGAVDFMWNGGSTEISSIGNITGTEGQFWLGNTSGITPSTSNWAMASDGSNITLNAAAGAVQLGSGGTPYLVLNSSGQLGGNASAASVSAATLGAQSSTFSVAAGGTFTLTIPQSATPLIVLTGGAPASNVVVVLPGAANVIYYVDYTAVTGLGTSTLGFKCGSSSTSNPITSNAKTLAVVACHGTNQIPAIDF